MSEYGSIAVAELVNKPTSAKRHTFKLLLDSVLITYDITRHRISQSRFGRAVNKRLKKIDGFVTNPKVVKAATAIIGIETVLGFFTCVGSITILIASGNAILAVFAGLGYVVTTVVRYIMARNAILETQNAKEAL